MSTSWRGGEPTVEVCALSRRRLRAHLEEVLAIERAAHAELGRRYSHEVWGPGEFLRERPGKWELSAGALLDGRLVGFLIASFDGDDGHVHRLGVHPEARRRGIARLLVDAVETELRRSGRRRVQLSVGDGNRPALTFWTRVGYRPLTEDEHRDYAARRGLKSAGAAVSVDGCAYTVLEKELRGRNATQRKEDSRDRRAPR